jgi:hypothetical protein
MDRFRLFEKLTVLIIACGALSACTMEASILTQPLAVIPDPSQEMQRTDADFVAGEVVTTANGTVIRGTFGEISEQQTLSNGVVIEGAFYE